MKPKLCFLICSNLVKEAAAVLESDSFDDAAILSFPACGPSGQVESDCLRKTLRARAGEYSRIELLGGGCIPGLRERLPELRCCHVHSPGQCFYMFANKEIVDAYQRAGAYLLTPGWLRDWRKRTDDWGFDRETARGFFGESARELLLLDTGVDPESDGRLREFGEYVDLPVRVVGVGLDYFRLLLTKLFHTWRLEEDKSTLTAASSDLDRQLADHAMVADLIGGLTGIRTETGVVQSIFELFTALCAPAGLLYVPLFDGEPGDAQSRPALHGGAEGAAGRLTTLDQDYAWADSGDGFVLRLAHLDSTVGVLEVDGLAFPEHREHYLNLALTIGKVCGLAIANARSFEALESSKGALCESEGRLRAILAAMEDQVFVFDEEGRFAFTHSPSRQPSSAHPDEFLGKAHSAMMPAEASELFEKGFERNRQGHSSECEYPVGSGQAQRWFAARLSPLILDGDSIGSVAVVRDITGRKQVELMKSEFVSTVSHELRTPLTAIRGSLGLLAGGAVGEVPEAGGQLLEIAVRSCDRLILLANRILEAAGIAAKTTYCTYFLKWFDVEYMKENINCE